MYPISIAFLLIYPSIISAQSKISTNPESIKTKPLVGFEYNIHYLPLTDYPSSKFYYAIITIYTNGLLTNKNPYLLKINCNDYKYNKNPNHQNNSVASKVNNKYENVKLSDLNIHFVKSVTTGEINVAPWLLEKSQEKLYFILGEKLIPQFYNWDIDFSPTIGETKHLYAGVSIVLKEPALLEDLVQTGPINVSIFYKKLLSGRLVKQVFDKNVIRNNLISIANDNIEHLYAPLFKFSNIKNVCCTNDGNENHLCLEKCAFYNLINFENIMNDEKYFFKFIDTLLKEDHNYHDLERHQLISYLSFLLQLYKENIHDDTVRKKYTNLVIRMEEIKGNKSTSIKLAKDYKKNAKFQDDPLKTPQVLAMVIFLCIFFFVIVILIFYIFVDKVYYAKKRKSEAEKRMREIERASTFVQENEDSV